MMKKTRGVLVCLLAALSMLVSSAYAESPDFSNTAADAQVIPVDGTSISGELISGDEDWFKITNPAYRLYSISLKGEWNKGYKYISVYQADELGVLHQTLNFCTWSDEVQIRSFYIEKGFDVYIKVYSNLGQYVFDVVESEQIIPDDHSNECAEPTYISVGTGPFDGVLEHKSDNNPEEDWFVFNTVAGHKYEVKNTRSDNTYIYMALFNEDCGVLKTDLVNTFTVASWFGESYKIRISSSSSYLGNYYTLEVVDLGLMEDEYNNTHAGAQTIPTDGTTIHGNVNYLATYQSDEDWFRFEPQANTLYQVSLSGEINKGYKDIYVYLADEYDNLVHTINFSNWSNETQVRTFFVEQQQVVYLKLFKDIGNYQFAVEKLGSYQPDGFDDTCANPRNITVDAGAVDGIITHITSSSTEIDWYQFSTEPQHKYEIRLTRAGNSYPYISVYNDNCNLIIPDGTSYTVTSWNGEPYKIKVSCSFGYLAIYYNLEVVDLGYCHDDFPNTYDQAVTIAKDGTEIDGEIDFVSSYHGDEDWFRFTAAIAGTYNFSLSGEVNKAYKYIKIYSLDEYNILREKRFMSVWSDGKIDFTADLPAGETFVKLYQDLGQYKFSVVSPDPRCGDLEHPYPLGDVNHDCYVDMVDIAMLAANWLNCSAPACDDYQPE